MIKKRYLAIGLIYMLFIMSEVELYLSIQILFFSPSFPLHILLINSVSVIHDGNVFFHSPIVFNFLYGIFLHTKVLDT